MDGLLTASQVSAETGASPKALRGYEDLGLISPVCADNGYRLYDRHQIEIAGRIRELNEIGIPLRDMAPFVDCLNAGSVYADDCPSSLAEYRRSIDRIDKTIKTLSAQRESLIGNLAQASRRLLGEMQAVDKENPNLAPLPEGLVEPVDDGACDHLYGTAIPDVGLPSTDDVPVDLGDLGPGRTLIYVFPMTGSPEVDMPDGWDSIPGARGCSPQNCDMRNHYADLMQRGVNRVYGLSSQPREYQVALAQALRLPYPLLTDERMELAKQIGLPTFTAGDLTVYRRLTLVITQGTIEHVFYPVFPPDQHAQVVLDWLAEHPIVG